MHDYDNSWYHFPTHVKQQKFIRQIVLIYANKNGTGKKCTQIYGNIQKFSIYNALKMGY